MADANTTKRIFLNGVKNTECCETSLPRKLGRWMLGSPSRRVGSAATISALTRRGSLLHKPPSSNFPWDTSSRVSLAKLVTGDGVTNLSVGDRVSVNPSTGGNIGFGGTERVPLARMLLSKTLKKMSMCSRSPNRCLLILLRFWNLWMLPTNVSSGAAPHQDTKLLSSELVPLALQLLHASSRKDLRTWQFATYLIIA